MGIEEFEDNKIETMSFVDGCLISECRTYGFCVMEINDWNHGCYSIQKKKPYLERENYVCTFWETFAQKIIWFEITNLIVS